MSRRAAAVCAVATPPTTTAAIAAATIAAAAAAAAAACTIRRCLYHLVQFFIDEVGLERIAVGPPMTAAFFAVGSSIFFVSPSSQTGSGLRPLGIAKSRATSGSNSDQAMS